MSRFPEYAKSVLEALLEGAELIYAISASHASSRRLAQLIHRPVISRSDRYHLHKQVKFLHENNLIRYTESGGIARLKLTKEGKRKALNLKPHDIKLPKNPQWDHKWRIIAFDIPEAKRNGRDALRGTMKHLGAIQLQKSLWVWPYECRHEIDLIAEIFNVSQYVHYIVAESVTAERQLRSQFRLT